MGKSLLALKLALFAVLIIGANQQEGVTCGEG